MTRIDWTPDDIPDLDGRRALVTGATGGIGEHTAVELARKGAQVVLAGRSQERLATAAEEVARRVPNARLRTVVLDLADLSSVRRGAAVASSYGPLDILVNNAGVMAAPNRRTVDGFDLQLATNHLGHFALTGLLLPQLVASGDARVVTVSSIMHAFARSVPLDDLRVQRGRYSRWRAYAESKLANLMFCFELDRRAREAELPLTSVAAHPGYASTNLVTGGLRLGGRTAHGTMIEAATRLVGQSASQGAMPSLMAATVPGLPGATYVGPGGFGETRGAPKIVGATRPARDEEMAHRLWELSEQATGISYP